MPLTDTAIRNAKPKHRPYKLFDGEGLYLLVNPNGNKLWRLKYRVLGREKLLAFGTYPVVGIREAREKRFAARKLHDAGVDPGAQKQETKQVALARAGNTLQAVAEQWFKANKAKWTTESAQSIWRRLERNILPKLTLPTHG